MVDLPLVPASSGKSWKRRQRSQQQFQSNSVKCYTSIVVYALFALQAVRTPRRHDKAVLLVCI